MNNNPEVRLRRILVVMSVAAYAAAGVTNLALAVSPGINARDAVAAACVMAIGAGVTLYFGRQKDFMKGPLLKGQPVVLGFAAGIWVNLVLAVAGGLYPVISVGRFISYMGYVGSIAFIPPVLTGAVILGIDRLREGTRK
jgi:hypothetical protein